MLHCPAAGTPAGDAHVDLRAVLLHLGDVDAPLVLNSAVLPLKIFTLPRPGTRIVYESGVLASFRRRPDS